MIGPLSTPRLQLDEVRASDADFVLELLNDPDFLTQIGDRGVRDLDAARSFISERIHASYLEFGFGMLAVRLRSNGEPLGLCGLVRRPQLEAVDIGYAFLPAARGRGYALEAARRVQDFATDELGIRRLLAIVRAENRPSRALLEKLGMRPEGAVRIEPDTPQLCLYGWRAPPAAPPPADPGGQTNHTGDG